MRFVEAVRAETVVGPLRRNFNERRWRDQHTQLREDDADDSLFEGGLLIRRKMTAIRLNVRHSAAEDLNKTTKIRSVVAAANHAFQVVASQTRDAISDIFSQHRPLLMSDVTNVKVADLTGTQRTPDEMMQGIVDGVHTSVRALLEEAGSTAGSVKFKRVNWGDVVLEINAGTLFVLAEDLWAEMLWNGYRLTEMPAGAYQFSVADDEWMRRYAISRARQNSLLQQFVSTAC